MNKKEKGYFQQWSTLRGLLLLGATVAGVDGAVAAAGFGLLETVVTSGAAIVTGVIGLTETIKDERKGA